MGYIYSGANLVCETCGGLNAKKKKCPFGWCKPTAICPECFAKIKRGWRKSHIEAGCQANSKAFDAREKLQTEIIASGRFLRISACTSTRPDKKIKVIFKGADVEKAFFMTEEAYNSIPIRTPATIEDFSKFEPLEIAKSLDIYSPL